MTALEQPPEVLPAADWRFPQAHESVLDNGMRVLVYHCPGQFVVNASLLFDVPLNAEPRTLEGVAGLTGRCLTRGAAGRDAEEFADALALCGADLEGTAFPDGFSVRLSSPVSHLREALSLMADVVRSPAFDSSEFDHEQLLRLREIDHAHAYPTHVAVEQLNAALYGESRAARPVGGTTDTVTAISSADVAAYADAHFQPRNATLVVAGDFVDVDPSRLATECFGTWGHVGSDPVTTEKRTVSENAQVVLVDWPDAPQSTLRLGGPGITRADPRWPAMFVANYLLGGSFSSRINQVLREQKGLTYGVSTTLDTGRAAGVLGVSTAVRADATVQALEETVSIIGDAAGTFTDDEVGRATSAITDSAVLGYERAGTVVGRVEMLLSQGLDLNYVDANLARIREVTAETANRAYTEVVAPDAMTVVVVGDGATLRDPLREWGYADVREVPVPT